ncbi:LOW QUALITY PROTEIN: nephrocystin-3-like [Liolophura sinensis]|uniref:LOW QUALITY PROTEIN: nephrocystin-3-like n=1 Tax=Liolophura sinensis TaxID=3198878 RepID=UPI003158A021
MGTGSSFLRHPDDDDGTDYGHGVIKRIPIEMKPRGRLAGLRSVSSLGRKQPKGGSLRSALSIDLENPEVERIKKDFEMYRLNKENEIANMQKKEQKCETENKRLRAELLALQKTCTKLRGERDVALEAEHQALARAAAFESDRDKVQRQFKIFRETKECEIQNLLRAKRELENKLSKVAHGYIPDDLDMNSREDLDENADSGNPGDWWTALESEPSFGSTMQLHQPMFRGPEFAHSMMEMEGPFTNVNKEDWSSALAKLTQVLPSIPEHVTSNLIRLYISAPRDMRTEVEIMEKECLCEVRQLCEREGRTLVTVHMPFNEHHSINAEEGEKALSKHSATGKHQKAKTTAGCRGSIVHAFAAAAAKNAEARGTEELARDAEIIYLHHLEAHVHESPNCCKSSPGGEMYHLFGLPWEHTNRFSGLEYSSGHLDNPGSRPAVFCFRDPAYKGCKPSQGEAKDLKSRVRGSGSAKVIDSYPSPNKGAELAFTELEKILKIELGIDMKKDKTDSYSSYSESDNPEELCGGALWDVHCDYEQLEALSYAVKSSCQLGFEKYYERLNNHVSAAGPLPPLLVSGAPGSGKSLLLAQWIQLQQERNANGLLMYHFVGQEFSVSGDPIVMMRRLTAQLMQHVSSPPALTCDPSRLMEEFPRWLEKVSSKTPGGAILILDSIDRFQNGEQHLKWLLDPLPVDIRVIVSVDEDTCPQSWRSWPTLQLEPLSNKNVKELLRAELAVDDVDLDAEEECKILTHCRTPGTCNPLYVLVLSRAISGCRFGDRDRMGKILDQILTAMDTVTLYKNVLQVILQEFATSDNKAIHKKILRYAILSRNGISERELRDLIPGLQWNYLAPLEDALMDRLIMTMRSGVLTFAHPEAYQACREILFTEADEAECSEAIQDLIQYFSSFLWPGKVTCRVADELPRLIKQTGNKEMLHRAILNLCVFQRLYARGRCAELLGYWQFVDADKVSMAYQYLEFTKKTEQYVGQFDGIVTLPRIADMNETLGRFLKDLALLTQALPALQRALELRETALDPDHPAVARSLHQLAGLHAQGGKFSTAEALYKQALEIYENAYSSEHQMVAKELEALAVLYQKQDKHDIAEPLRKRAMSIRKKTRTPRVGSGHSRGITPLRRQAVNTEELAMVPESPELARTLNELGVLYYLQNNIDSAEAFFKRSLEIREVLLGEEHPDLAQSLNNLAALYNDRKQYDKAVPLYERALHIRNQYLSPDHPSVASIIKHLAMLYKKQGNLAEAIPLYRQAVEIREKCFGSQHPAVATALVNLAVLYSQQNNYAEAEPLYERALHIYEDSFGSHHPRVAETLRNLAVMKYEQRDYETAAKFYKRATEIKDRDSSYAGKNMLRCSSSDDTNSTVKNILQA